MGPGEAERLECLTLSLLRNHGAFSSDEFMEGYNIIYNHCTEVTPTFEIRGKRVYECVKKAIGTFVGQLRCFTSLKDFHAQVSEFSEALELMAKVYSYLEKYFIRISLERRDGQTQDIRTLGYSTFYRGHVESGVHQVKEFILFEIGVTRSNKKYDFPQLAETIKLTRKMLFYSDSEEEYNNLIKRYLCVFQETVDFGGEIGRVLKRVYLEIYISSRVFECDSSKLHRKIVGRLKGRFGDILGFMSRRMETFSRFKLYVKIVHFMDEEYMMRVVEEYKRVVSGKILESSDFETLTDMYLRICSQMEENFVGGEELLPDIKEHVRQYFDTSGDEMLGNKICRHICRVMERGESRRGELEALVTFMTLVPNREAMIEDVTSSLQRRLLGGRSGLRMEGRLVSLMEKHLGGGAVTRASISYNNHVEVIRNSFNLSTQSSRFLTELRLLTKGFYSMEGSRENVPYPLSDIQKIIIQPQLMKHPRGEVQCCYGVSPMIFQMGGFNFRISTDKFLILWWLDVERGVEELRECVGGERFKENLEYLLSNGFVVQSNGVVSLNDRFSDNEYNYIRGKYGDRVCLMDSECNLVCRDPQEPVGGEVGRSSDDGAESQSGAWKGLGSFEVEDGTVRSTEGVEEVMDLFDVEYSDRGKEKRREERSVDSMNIVVEAKVMRMLKREKRVSLEKIVRTMEEEVGEGEESVVAGINRLVEKEYAVVEDGYVSYLS